MNNIWKYVKKYYVLMPFVGVFSTNPVSLTLPFTVTGQYVGFLAVISLHVFLFKLWIDKKANFTFMVIWMSQACRTVDRGKDNECIYMYIHSDTRVKRIFEEKKLLQLITRNCLLDVLIIYGFLISTNIKLLKLI